MTRTIAEEIKRLKEEKNAVILAHYYVRPEVQEIADYIGDSFYLSKLAVGLEAQTIVMCGVSFMGESVKILNPEKTVLRPQTAPWPTWLPWRLLNRCGKPGTTWPLSATSTLQLS